MLQDWEEQRQSAEAMLAHVRRGASRAAEPAPYALVNRWRRRVWWAVAVAAGLAVALLRAVLR